MLKRGKEERKDREGRERVIDREGKTEGREREMGFLINPEHKQYFLEAKRY